MKELPFAKKSLGQHWLTDPASLAAMADAAEVGPDDIVLEVGPGLGTLTTVLCDRAKKVIAVEFDGKLAQELPSRVKAANLEVRQEDILSFDLSTMPENYKLVANIPYYLTSKLIRNLSESQCPPRIAAILVQKEVAQSVAAKPGDMSVLSITAQYYWETSTGLVMPAKLFTPPPKVDSQILLLRRRAQPLFTNVDTKGLFRIVKICFSNRRKTLLNSLSSGLHASKADVTQLITKAELSPTMRPQELSLDEWYRLYQILIKNT